MIQNERSYPWLTQEKGHQELDGFATALKALTIICMVHVLSTTIYINTLYIYLYIYIYTYIYIYYIL